MLLSGLLLTIETSLCAWIIALVCGAVIGAILGLPSYTLFVLRVGCLSMTPPLTSEFLSTIKNTSVAITIGLIELTGEARAMQEFSFQVFEAFTGATGLFLLINVGVVIAMRFLERALAVPGYITGK